MRICVAERPIHRRDFPAILPGPSTQGSLNSQSKAKRGHSARQIMLILCRMPRPLWCFLMPLVLQPHRTNDSAVMALYETS